MKLGEKIYALRKRLGMSQEDLASTLNVSRQSISNWETGAANPEIGKLSLLAETLGVSVDFLLDEDTSLDELDMSIYPDWLDGLPKFLQTGIYRYGWLYGVRISLSGLVFIVFGIIAKAVTGGFMRDTAFIGIGDSAVITPDDLPPEVIRQINGQMGYKPPGSSFMYIIPNAALIIGLVVMIIGIVLAIALKQWGDKQQHK
ncbi:MAG: helix-turn-helix transcriptional regulator [Eubacteriales bacterium]|nr:helix-turn-helix transcriptional regulator [Eubacteriales bacterium]